MPSPRLCITTAAAAALSLPAVSACAQDAPPDPSPEPSGWTASAELLLWRPALQDDVALPGAGVISVEDINLDDNEFTPMVVATFHSDAWRIELGGFDYSGSGDGPAARAFEFGEVAVGAGDDFRAEIDYASAWVHVMRRVWDEDLGHDVSLKLDAGGGLRVSDIRMKIASGGASQNEDSLWADLLLVSRLAIGLPENLSFDIHGELGGGPDSTAWAAGARLRWQPEPYLGAELGYRFHRSDLDDDVLFDGALAGLYLGLSFEF